MDRLVIECSPEFKLRVKLYCLNNKIKLKDYVTKLIENDLN